MKQKLNPMAWVRLVIYVLSALVGVAAVVATSIGQGEIAALLGTLAGAGAAVTGGTAVYNLPKAPDNNKLEGVDLTAVLAAIPTIANAAQTYQKAMDYQPKHAVETASEGTYPGLEG